MKADRRFLTELCNMCMIVDEQNNRALVQDKVSKEKESKWNGYTFPGGHVERGESIVDSVIRGVWEETGLRIDSSGLRLCGVVDWENTESPERYMVFLYRASRFSGELLQADETPEGRVFWMDLDELISSEKTIPDVRTYLELFLKDKNEAYATWTRDQDSLLTVQ